MLVTSYWLTHAAREPSLPMIFSSQLKELKTKKLMLFILQFDFQIK